MASFMPDQGNVGAARKFVLDTLLGWGDASYDQDAAALMTDELVTNAFVHARSPVTVTARCDPPTVTVEVQDDSAQPPELRSHDPEAISGRGLRIVDELADDWGFRPVPGGKIFWFTITPIVG